MPPRYATTPGTRRRPWPYDAIIGGLKGFSEDKNPLFEGGIKVILEPDQDGNLVSENTKTLDATAPVDYTYGSANPYQERTSEWASLYGGFGQAIAPDGKPHRYFYAQNADLSIDGLWMKGPAFEQHTQTISSVAGQVRQFVVALRSGAPTLFAICEQGVWYRSNDDPTGGWVASLTSTTTPALPGSTYPQQAVRYAHRGTTPIDALYLACSQGNLWRFRGASGDSNQWEVCTDSPGPPGDEAARYLERVGDELWAASNYSCVRIDDQDPFTPTEWSGEFFIGDRHARITWLKQVDDTLYVFKEDGIYTIDADGFDHELFPTLREKSSYYNGKNAAVWLDRMWFTYGNQTFTLTGGAQLKADGLEQMLENTSPVKGRWVGGSGHNTWFFYEIYYNSLTDTSYLVKHGTWIEESDEQATPGVAQFAEAHHGSIFEWPDTEATAIETVASSTLWATPNDRLYVGFEDGTCAWAYLPRHSPNPAEDENCEFTTLPSYVYLPQHHSQFRADNKVWHAMTAFGLTLTTEEWVRMEYRTDVTNPDSDWIPVSPTSPNYTMVGQRKNIVNDEVTYPVYGRVLAVRVALEKAPLVNPDPDGPESPLNHTPILEGIAIHESIRPAFARDFTFSIRLGNFLPKRDGTVDRRRAHDVQTEILKQCAKVGPINIMLPTGTVEEMTITDYRDSMLSRQKYRDHTWLLQVKAIQLRTITEGAPQTDAPITTGLTYDTLEQYTLGELETVI
jgi:hypothetical protein